MCIGNQLATYTTICIQIFSMISRDGIFVVFVVNFAFTKFSS